MTSPLFLGDPSPWINIFEWPPSKLSFGTQGLGLGKHEFINAKVQIYTNCSTTRQSNKVKKTLLQRENNISWVYSGGFWSSFEGANYLTDGHNYLIKGPDHQRGARLSFGGARLSIGGVWLSERGPTILERGPTVFRRGPTILNLVWDKVRGPTIMQRGQTIREGPDYERGARLSTE